MSLLPDYFIEDEIIHVTQWLMNTALNKTHLTSESIFVYVLCAFVTFQKDLNSHKYNNKGLICVALEPGLVLTL